MKLVLVVLVLAVLGVAQSTVYLPMVAREGLPLRGAALFAWNCDAVELLALDWWYIGPRQCSRGEYVHYLEAPTWSGQATPFTMFYNEPELNGWSVQEMVAAFVPYANANPGVVWVGPCVVFDLDLVPRFWAEFERVAGYKMPPEQMRFCFHCYHNAATCQYWTEQAADRAAKMGLPERSLWLTEFGYPLGLDRTMRQQLEDTRALLAFLDGDDRIERYAYWPGVYWPLDNIPELGIRAAPEPMVGAVPLLYQTYWPGARGQEVVGYQLTAMGQMYRER